MVCRRHSHVKRTDPEYIDIGQWGGYNTKRKYDLTENAIRTRMKSKHLVKNMVKSRLGVEAARRFETSLPSPSDRTIPKRLWEKIISIWRRASHHADRPAFIVFNVRGQVTNVDFVAR